MGFEGRTRAAGKRIEMAEFSEWRAIEPPGARFSPPRAPWFDTAVWKLLE
jgi:hypothetical protein